MSITNLHKVSTQSGPGDLLMKIGDGELSLENIQEETISSLCQDYPYDGQSTYSGDILYSEDPEFGRGRELEFSFELRTGSHLFVLESDVDVSIDNLIRQINAESPPEFELYWTLTPNRERLWEFISNADSIVELTVISENNVRVDPSNLDEKQREELVGNAPIDGATFSYNFHDNSILVRYTDGSLNIESEFKEANEYILQLFERDVIYQSE